jgi:hypothetical protein
MSKDAGYMGDGGFPRNGREGCNRIEAIKKFTDFECSPEAQKLYDCDFTSVAAGYFLGLGFSAAEARKMASEWYASSCVT